MPDHGNEPDAIEPSRPTLLSRISSSTRRFSPIVFALLILLSIGCRFRGLDWDASTTLHPDERFLVSLVAQIKPAQSVSEFFNSRISPLNPVNLPNIHFVYGQLPLFIGSFVGHQLDRIEGTKFLLIGRFLSGLFDCGTILLTFLIARRLFSLRWSLLAATLVAGTALHIQQSHYFVVDSFAAFFLTGSFWAGARLIDHQRRRDAILCGLFFGAALACKISAALFAIALLGFLLALSRRTSRSKTVICALLCILAAFLAFRVGHPMAFRGEFGFFDLRPEPRFWHDVGEQGYITKGVTDVPFNVQWIGRKPWLFSLWNLGAWGYGWLFLLSGAAGIWALLKNRRGNSTLWIAALFGLALLGVQGAAFSKFTRYFLPLTPMCALLATYFWRQLSSKRQEWQWGGAITALSVVLWGFSVASIYTRPHTRLEASLWIAANLPPGTPVANETDWDEGLPISWYSKLPPTSLNTVGLKSYDVDTLLKRDELAQKLDASQWIFLSSGRSWQNIPRWPAKWPMMTEFYRALFDGRLGFRLEQKFTSFPRLGPFEFPDANIEEALTVYDHPMVLLFHKTPDYDPENVRRILESVELPTGQTWEPRLAPAPNELKLPTPPGF